MRPRGNRFRLIRGTVECIQFQVDLGEGDSDFTEDGVM